MNCARGLDTADAGLVHTRPAAKHRSALLHDGKTLVSQLVTLPPNLEMETCELEHGWDLLACAHVWDLLKPLVPAVTMNNRDKLRVEGEGDS